LSTTNTSIGLSDWSSKLLIAFTDAPGSAKETTMAVIDAIMIVTKYARSSRLSVSPTVRIYVVRSLEDSINEHKVLISRCSPGL